MAESQTIVLILTSHPKWGVVLLPALVEVRASGELFLLETAQKSFSNFPNLNEKTREIFALTERYADGSLMKSYSKQKTIREFQATVTDETIVKFIRPFIERCHQKMVRLMIDSGLPLYARGEIKQRTFWPADRIELPTQVSNVVFCFEKEETGLRYRLRIENENGLMDLYERSCTVLCQEPAVVVSNKNLFFFETIDAKKLLPFFSKKAVQVPPSSEKQYLKTFVRNCVQDHQVQSIGLDIKEIQPTKSANLSLEYDWNKQLVLLVHLVYEGKNYPLDHTHRKIVWTEETEDQVRLRWFYPDKTWEKQQFDILTENGLRQTGPNTFTLPKDASPALEGDSNGLIDWLRTHRQVTSAFHFTQKMNFYLGEIVLQTQLDSKQDWFDLHCLVVFDHFRIPFNRFRQHILNNNREYVLPDGSIALLPTEWFERYRDLMFFSKDQQDGMVLRKNQYRIAETLVDDLLLPIPSNEVQVPLPAGFRAELRQYQQAGFQWLVWLYRNGFGGCLADDMGLGKTVQAIALLAFLEEEQRKATTATAPSSLPAGFPIGVRQLSLFEAVKEPEPSSKRMPSLVVMPTSLLYNWQNELRKFAPNLNVYTYSGSKRLKSKDIEKVFGHYPVILTTYSVLRNDIEWLKNCRFHHLLLDESQYVKNPDSQTYHAVQQIQRDYTIALTGTPVENSLSDLWAQFNLLNENMLGSHSSFRNAYENPIAKEDKEKEAALLRLIQPFLLRRTKQEVAPDLPPLLEETVYCDMSPAQKNAYSKEKNALRNSLMEDKAWDNPKQLSFLTLQGLTRLRLMANHPVLALPDYTEDSGKFDQVLMRLETLRSEGHKVLIFSSFVRHLRLLANVLEQENQPYAWLTGSTPASDREKVINRFSTKPDVHCFLISLKAGGVGLNLTAADYVFLLDPWWNPASEMQALSRSHRIGQDKKVIVYRFISSKTIEEKIRRLQESKSKLANTFVRSVNPLADLSREDLGQLIE